MLEMLRKKHERNEDEGFTLIELMVVVLIIAILIAIAIPTFLGAQNRARDRAAQSDLRNALTAAKTLATDQEGKFLNASGTAITPADLFAVEAALSYQDAFPTSTSGNVVGVSTESTGLHITMSRRSASGTIFTLFATDQGAVTYCKNLSAHPSAASGCSGTKW